jgi:hypothetical protein
MGNVASRRVLYQQFAEGDVEEASILAPWTEIDQAELDVLKNAPIVSSNTACRQFEEQKKWDAEQVYAKMSAEEKEILKRRMEVSAGDKESKPPSPTPK